MLTFLTILRYLVWAALIFFDVRSIVKTIRTRARAKKSGLIKTYIYPAVLIVMLCCCTILATIAFTSFNQAAQAKKSSTEWEQLRSVENEDYYLDYYNELLAKNGGTQITDFGKYTEFQIKTYSNRARSFTDASIWTLYLIVMLLVFGLEKVFYITEAGCVTQILKEPEEIIAQRRDDKIDLYFKSVTDREKPLISFKATPKNLADLGRFIEWDD